MELWSAGALNQLLILLLLLCGLIPGVILLFATANRFRCTKCGKLIRSRHASRRLTA